MAQKRQKFRKCAIKTCETYAQSGFSIIPEHPVQRNAWITACEFPDNVKGARICYKHFKTTDFKSEIDFDNLPQWPCKFPPVKPSAVPSLFLPSSIESPSIVFENQFLEPCDPPISSNDPNIVIRKYLNVAKLQTLCHISLQTTLNNLQKQNQAKGVVFLRIRTYII